MVGHTSSGQAINLQQFMVDLLEARGALLDFPAYALVEAILPRDLAQELEVGEHLLLAFDCEVAAETPGALLVTYGSPLFDRAVRAALATGRLTRRWATLQRCPPPPSLLERAERRLRFVRCRRPSLGDVDVVRAELLAFRFLVRYISDERREKVHEVVVDASYCKDVGEKGDKLRGVFFAPSSPEVEALLPAPHCGYAAAYSVAKAALPGAITGHLEAFRREMFELFQRDGRRVSAYYRATLADLAKRLERLPLDDPRRERLAEKIAATQSDYAKRLDDVREKYRIRLEAKLDSLRIYMVPKVRFTLKLPHKDKTVFLTLYYNLALNEVEPPLCPSCGRFVDVIGVRDDGSLACPVCFD